MLLKTSRRTFLKGLTLSGVAGSLGVWSFNARSSLSLPVAASLQGTQFDLTIGETAVNITGSERQAKTINGGLPGPVLRWKEGDTITLKVKNRLNEQTSIHWHGIILPANMDGVPGLSFMGIEPDDTYVYTFKVKQKRDLLVPQPFWSAGTGGGIRCHYHRCQGARTVCLRS